MTIYTITPKIAACLDLKSDDGVWDQTFVWLSHEKGVVYGSRDYPLDKSSLPVTVQLSILRHFNTVFALEHEKWTDKEPSPRAKYCDSLQPWTVEVPE